MRTGLLTRYMETGFLHLKQVSGLPKWLVPDMAGAARKLGDQTILELAKPLGLSERVEGYLAQAPEANSLPVEIWQEAIGRWPAVHQVLPVTMALLRAREKVEALKRRGVLKVDTALLGHGLATICCAVFAPNGSEILSRLASILGGSPTEPAGLVERYTAALADGDEDTLGKIEECIQQDPAWAAWSKRLTDTGKALPYIPRVIGISPDPTSGLIQLLAAMIVEVINADNSRDAAN